MGDISLLHTCFAREKRPPIAETPPSLLSKKTLPMLEEIEQAESCRHRDSEHIDGSYQEAEDAETKKNLAVRHQLQCTYDAKEEEYDSVDDSHEVVGITIGIVLLTLFEHSLRFSEK